MIIQTESPPLDATSDGLLKNDLPRKEITSEFITKADTAQPFIDRFGHKHSSSIFRHWSPAVIQAMGVRRIKPDEAAGGVV